MLEYWVNEGDKVWNYSSDELLDLAKNDLKVFRGVNEISIIDYELVRIKKAYPVPDLMLFNRKKLLHEYFSQIRSLYVLGRANQKDFNYGVELAMLDGIMLARSILK